MGKHLYILIAFVLCLSAAWCRGDDDSPQRKWFDSEVSASGHIPDLAGWSIGYTEKIFPALSAEEARVLREQIGDKPDHPRKPDLDAFDDFARTGQPYTIHLRFFSAGEGMWRWCISHPSEFWDAAMSPKGAWELTSKSVSIHAVDDAASDAAKKRLSMIIPQVSKFMFGGLGIAATSNLKFTKFEILTDGQWRAVGVIADKPNVGYFHVFEGHWDATNQRGFVDNSSIYHKGYPGAISEREHYSDWRYSEDAGRWLANRIDRLNPAGRVQRSFEIESIEKDPAPLDQLTSVPQMNVDDPVRGRLNLMEVIDHRSGEYTAINSDGTIQHGLVSTEDGKPMSFWNVGGWTVLTLIAVGAIVLVKKRLHARKYARRT